MLFATIDCSILKLIQKNNDSMFESPNNRVLEQTKQFWFYFYRCTFLVLKRQISQKSNNLLMTNLK